MSDCKVSFRKTDWHPEIAISTTSAENTIWTMQFAHHSSKTRYNAHRKVREDFTAEFPSIVFIGSAPLYFYFTDAADEMFFMLKYSGNEFEVSI